MDRIRAGDLAVEIAFVLSNNSKSGALAKASAFGIPAYHISAVTEGNEERAIARMVELAQMQSIDLLVLAGYMKKVPAALLAKLRNRVINIHPALLPAFGGEGFYGHKVHEGVVARGCQFTGITIHMVNEAYDQGQIVLQRTVAVPAGCTAEDLSGIVLKQEHAYYWRVLRAFANGEIKPTESLDASRAVTLGRFPDSIGSGNAS